MSLETPIDYYQINCNQNVKMQLFQKLKEVGGSDSEPPLIFCFFFLSIFYLDPESLC